MRHPCELGGAYFLYSAVMCQLSVFISAILYLRYYVPSASAGNVLGAVLNGTTDNATAASSFASVLEHPAANRTLADSAVDKIDPHTLIASAVTLFAVWAISVVGLALTIKPKYRRTFWSTQTGCAYVQSHFLDHEGRDATRAQILTFNERQWRAIRDRVRQWVLSMYATWQALTPSWLTDAIRSLIPDDFIPAEALRQDNAQAPGGRRQTLANASRRRRVSLALGSNAVQSESDADAAASVIAVPSPLPIGGGEDGGDL